MRCCANCGAQFTASVHQAAKMRTYCSNKCRNHSRRQSQMIEQKCIQCGKSFVTQRRSGGKTAVVCSLQCHGIRQSQLNIALRELCSCQKCGRQFAKRSRRNDANRFCSRNCGGTAKKQIKESQHRKMIFAIADGFLRVMHKWIRLEQLRIHAEDMRRQRVRVASVACCKCGTTFERTEGLRGFPKQNCPTCIGSAKKKLRKAHKRLRRARTKGSDGVKVDPDEIFQRDNWRCQLCGRKVTKKVSPNDDTYPNLDHVIPACDHGPHRPENLQCLCRACNLKKSDKRLNLF